MLKPYSVWDKGGYGLGVWLSKENLPFIVGSDPGIEAISFYDYRKKKQITVISNMGESEVYQIYRSILKQ